MHPLLLPFHTSAIARHVIISFQDIANNLSQLNDGFYDAFLSYNTQLKCYSLLTFLCFEVELALFDVYELMHSCGFVTRYMN